MTFLLQLADFFARLLNLYSILIWIRIILSWFNPYARQGTLTGYFAMIVDPYLNLFRSKHFRLGMIDFSALIGIGLISVVQSLLSLFSRYGTLRLRWILQLALSAFWSYGISIFFLIMILILIFRTIDAFSHNRSINRMGAMAEPFISKVRYWFFPGRLVKETTLCVTSTIVMVVLYFVAKYAIQILMQLSSRIPF